MLLGGLIFFIAATFACSLAPSIGGLAGLRILQGLGAASGSVIGRALTRDAYTFQEMPLVIGLMPFAVLTVLSARLLHSRLRPPKLGS